MVMDLSVANLLSLRVCFSSLRAGLGPRPEPIGPKLFILGEPVLKTACAALRRCMPALPAPRRKFYTVYDAEKKRRWPKCPHGYKVTQEGE